MNGNTTTIKISAKTTIPTMMRAFFMRTSRGSFADARRSGSGVERGNHTPPGGRRCAASFLRWVGRQFLKVHPYFDSVRVYPRFAEMVRRVGLE
jgi:hypothetical protein